MNPKRLNAMKTNVLLSMFAVTVMIAFTSCSKKIIFQQSSIVPAAQGYVNVSKDKSENYVVEIELKNFAGVERLEPANRTYVVWMVTDRQSTVNIGRISTTNKLNASFKTITSFRPVKIFITAEEREDARYPDPMVVLSTTNF